MTPCELAFVGTEFGAEYLPVLLIAPQAGPPVWQLMDHVTAVLLEPVTVAVKFCCV